MCVRGKNLCEDRPCDAGLQCIQSEEAPFYKCKECPPGYTSDDGFNCVDLDECYFLKPCDPKVQCTNLSPGFRCESCPPGYHGQHFQGLFLAAADQRFQRQRCEDINECREGTARCGPNSECINTEGSYSCACLPGFIQSDLTKGCVPMPGLCADGMTVCDKNAYCQNIGGRRYGCKCKVGFAGDGFFCGGDKDLDGWPDQDLNCVDLRCRKDNCPNIPVSLLHVIT